MNLLARFLHRPQPQHTADAVIARRVESDRMRKAKAERRAEERAAALAKARTLGRCTTPLRPREEIAAEVLAEREARKSPRCAAAPKEDGSGHGKFPVHAAGVRAVHSDGINRAVESISAEPFEGRLS